MTTYTHTRIKLLYIWSEGERQFNSNKIMDHRSSCNEQWMLYIPFKFSGFLELAGRKSKAEPNPAQPETQERQTHAAPAVVKKKLEFVL